MRIGLVLVILSAPLLLATAAHAERHYDCTKPANANKAACKAAPLATTAAKPTGAVVKPTAAKPTTATAKPTAERHYDCTKPANTNKAVCKGAPIAPAASQKPSQPASVKPSPAAANNVTSTPATASAMKPAPAPATTAAAPHAGSSITTTPAGASGQCKDGTFTHSKTHSGACSHHGGVAKWL